MVVAYWEEQKKCGEELVATQGLKDSVRLSFGMVFKYSTFMIEIFRQNGFVKLNFKLYPLFQKKI